MRDANTKPLSERLKLPENARDVTPQQSGTKLALVGPPFEEKLGSEVSKRDKATIKARKNKAKRAPAKSGSKLRRTDTIKCDKATTKPARKKMAKRTAA